MSTPEHGTRARYLPAGGACRCDACKAAQRDYQREYRRQGRDKEAMNRCGTCAPGLGWPRMPGNPLTDGPASSTSHLSRQEEPS